MTRLRARARITTVLLGTISGLALSASGAAQDAPPDAPGAAPLRPSVNLYGSTGLIDLPSAEMQPDGEITASYSYFGGQTRRNLTFQLLPRISATLRYSTIEDWGRPNDPSYDLYDRSFDINFQVLRESGPWQPSLVIGLRDFLGTGVYSAEYLVATKTVTPALTVTGGIGWGRLSSLGGFSNPVCDVVGGGACEREAYDTEEGGTPNWGSFFQGEDVAAFAGVEWRSPIEGLSFKAEYSPDAYEREQQGPNADFERKSRWNFGAEYRVRPGITIGGYWMYGSEVGFNLAVSANPNRPLTPQDLAPGPLPVSPRPAGAPMGTGWAANEGARDQLGAALAEALSAEGLRLEGMRVEATTVEVEITNRRYNQDPRAIGRAMRVLATGLPPSVETVRITSLGDGLAASTVVIDRAQYEALIDQPDAGQRSWEAFPVESAALAPLPGAAIWRPEGVFPRFDWSIVPAPYVVLLTPDDPIRFGLNADAEGTYHFSRAASVTLGVSQPVLGTFDDPGPSDTALQPVRSESARYYSGTAPKLVRLSADYVTQVSDSVYVRASGGYLERMFAGVGGEVLWKPADQNWGLGADLNYVWQKDYDGLGFGDYDYDVVTGHASLYWDTGFYDFEVQVDAGRYLAGDWGSTLTLTRRFANGWAVGAYASVTDVSSEDFGEGSFDKGITLEIPFRWTTPFETRSRNALEFRSISRDGGAKLNIENRLYPSVRDLGAPRLERNWGSFWQ